MSSATLAGRRVTDADVATGAHTDAVSAARTPAADAALPRRIRAWAYGLGFSSCGIATLGPAESAPYYEAWLEAGHAGAMRYMHRYKRQRRDPRVVHRGVVSAIVVTMDYGGRSPSGPIARYARGADYHGVLGARLAALHELLTADVGGPVVGKVVVDSTPLLERDLARRAGLGWFGKNTMLIDPERGSFFVLGALLVDLPLAADAPFTADRCGTCTRCLDACPTDALVAPRVLDARRCISYLTIELHGPIPVELRSLIGELVVGCDICQDVCPFNVKFATQLAEPVLKPRPDLESPSLMEWMRMTPDEWAIFAAGSPIERTGRAGFLRNVAVALGNRGLPDAVPALVAALSDKEPLVRGHAAWALGRIGTPAARDALVSTQSMETDAWVLTEIALASGAGYA